MRGCGATSRAAVYRIDDRRRQEVSPQSACSVARHNRKLPWATQSGNLKTCNLVGAESDRACATETREGEEMKCCNLLGAWESYQRGEYGEPKPMIEIGGKPICGTS